MTPKSMTLVAVMAGIFLAMVPGKASARPRAQHPQIAKLGERPVYIRDQVLEQSPALARAAASGGIYTASNGEQVQVSLSDGYVPDPTVNQQWAEFFSRLDHGPELSSLNVYVAPYEELTRLCNAESDACYAPGANLMVVAGNVPPDGTPIEDSAAHEYGHHIAAHRNNFPWPAGDYGPKNWASYENVCAATRARQFFPGAEDDRNYPVNPGEGWAEAYRVSQGGNADDFRVAPLFIPDAKDLTAIQRDIYRPWTAPRRARARGSFGPRSKPRVLYYLTSLDGQLTVKLTGSRRLDADLYVYDQKSRVLGRSRRRGPNERVRFNVCGQPAVYVAVSPYAGKGSWSVIVDRP